MGIFANFDKKDELDKIQKQMEQNEANGKGYKELPAGKYIVKLERLEMKLTKTNPRPMVAAMFRITEGEHKKQCMFKNFIIAGTKNDGGAIGSFLGWVKNLEALDEDGKPFDLRFTSYDDLNGLVMDIKEAVDADDLSYEVDYDPERKFKEILINKVV